MKFLFTTFCLLLTCLTFGQSTRDTIVSYNGHQARMKMEFDKDGAKIKETVLYDNGKTETVYFYSDNKNTHWIAYDTLGTKTAEWQDPEIENSKHRNTKNLFLTIVTLLLGSITWWASKKIGYKKTYFIVAYSSIIITCLAFIFQNRVDTEHINDLLLKGMSSLIRTRVVNLSELCISSILLVLPALLLVLSVSNFFRKTGINILASIIFSIFCIWILLFYTIAILTAGIGILS